MGMGGGGNQAKKQRVSLLIKVRGDILAANMEKDSFAWMRARAIEEINELEQWLQDNQDAPLSARLAVYRQAEGAKETLQMIEEKMQKLEAVEA